MNKHPEDQTLCAHVEELLIRSQLESLDDHEGHLLQAHLRTCAQCQAYQARLRRFHAALDLSQEEDLQPDPAIQIRLRQALPGGIPRRPRFGEWLAQQRWLRPVPQTAVVLAAIAIILLNADEFALSSPQPPSVWLASSQAEYTRVDAYEEVHRWQLVSERKVDEHRTRETLPIPPLPVHPEPADSI